MRFETFRKGKFILYFFTKNPRSKVNVGQSGQKPYTYKGLKIFLHYFKIDASKKVAFTSLK
jgi:hypothetical protein